MFFAVDDERVPRLVAQAERFDRDPLRRERVAPAAVLDRVEAYYSRNQIQPKTQYFVEAVLEEMQHENGS